MEKNQTSIGKILRRQRAALSLTAAELAEKARVSAAHIGRIERGERLPCGHVLQKLAAPLEFRQDELLALGGYLPSSPQKECLPEIGRGLDLIVARVLSGESVEAQRLVVAALLVMKSVATSMAYRDRES